MGLFLLFVSHGLSSILSSRHNHDRLFVLMVVFIFYTAGSLEKELTKCRSLSSQCLSTPQQMTVMIPPAGRVMLSFSHPYWDQMQSTLLCSTFSITSTGNKICTRPPKTAVHFIRCCEWVPILDFAMTLKVSLYTTLRIILQLWVVSLWSWEYQVEKYKSRTITSKSYIKREQEHT